MKNKKTSAAKPPNHKSATPAKQKPGRVIRVDTVIQKHLETKARPGETISATLRRLIGLPPRKGAPEFHVYYALPSDLFETAAEARGRAVLSAVRSGKKRPTEKPIVLRSEV